MSFFGRTLHQNAAIEVALDTTDIGGTNATSKYVDMSQFGTVDFVVQLGATLEGTPDGWNAADALDDFSLKEATDAAGSGAAVITGATNVQTTAGTAGDIHIITLHSDALSTSGKHFVAAFVEEDDNTGPDFVTILAIRYHPRYKHDDLTTSATNSSHVVV